VVQPNVRTRVPTASERNLPCAAAFAEGRSTARAARHTEQGSAGRRGGRKSADRHRTGSRLHSEVRSPPRASEARPTSRRAGRCTPSAAAAWHVVRCTQHTHVSRTPQAVHAVTVQHSAAQRRMRFQCGNVRERYEPTCSAALKRCAAVLSGATAAARCTSDKATIRRMVTYRDNHHGCMSACAAKRRAIVCRSALLSAALSK
jgi:hypothetical protein